MPHPRKGPRLYLRRRPGRAATYVILDSGCPERSTGTDDLREAEAILADYLEKKRRRDSPAAPDQLTVADAIALYAEEHAPTVADPARIGYAIQALLPFWGALPCTAVRAETCRRYAATRAAGPGTVRKELGTLRAALNWCAREGYLLGAPPVTLPRPPRSTQRALTRPEAAQLLRTARRLGLRHVAHFILVGLYTGTRRDAILGLRLTGPATTGGWFDLGKGVMYRLGSAERETRKRRPPVRLPRQLRAHARRWQAAGATWAVEWQGARVGSIKTAWRHLVAETGLDWAPTPHTLKHTAITWAIEAGASITDAAGFFGTSTETIERVYWHLSPHYQSRVVEAMERRNR